MYYPESPATPGPPPDALAPVLVLFAGRARQSRVTVLFRILLVIPHVVILWALGIAAEVVAIIGWFGALFTGRLPAFAAEYLTGYLRWQTRVYAYLGLLTDVYPPFVLDDAPYPIRVATRPGRLNRLAVLFRFFLLIPAYMVLGLLSYGAFIIVAFVTWIIVLITATMPEPLYQALAAAHRYMARVYGYVFMLTSAYPSGLFGDRPQPPAPYAGGPYAGGPYAGGSFAGAPDVGGPYGGSPYDEGPYGGAPFAGGPPPQESPRVTDTPSPIYGTFVGQGPGTADPWSLVLSSGARKLVGSFLVIGVLVIAGATTAGAIAGAGTVDRVNAFNQAQAAVAPVNQALSADNSKLQACGQNLPCITRLDMSLANVMNTFAGQIESIAMPAGDATTDQAKVAADARKLAGDYRQLGGATSASQYISLAQSLGVRTDFNALSADYDKLGKALGAH